MQDSVECTILHFALKRITDSDVMVLLINTFPGACEIGDSGILNDAKYKNKINFVTLK